MRKVKFNKWIKAKYFPEINGSHQLRVGTGEWQSDYPNEGLFHQWGNAYEEFESDAGNYSVALVEISDGTIVEVLPSNIKFEI